MKTWLLTYYFYGLGDLQVLRFTSKEELDKALAEIQALQADNRYSQIEVWEKVNHEISHLR